VHHGVHPFTPAEKQSNQGNNDQRREEQPDLDAHQAREHIKHVMVKQCNRDKNKTATNIKPPVPLAVRDNFQAIDNIIKHIDTCL
jgi:hypothetical protein